MSIARDIVMFNVIHVHLHQSLPFHLPPTESAAHVVEDLLPGVSYVFRVSAMNEVGMGPRSKPSGPLTITNEPGKCAHSEISIVLQRGLLLSFLAYPDYDSDSPSIDEVRMKMTSFDFEYSQGEEIGRYTPLPSHARTHTHTLYMVTHLYMYCANNMLLLCL